MGKYDALGRHLSHQASDEVAMSFDEIEQVIGAKLPAKAQLQRAWWSNNPSNNVMTRAWLAAGFRSEQVDMSARKLVFKREHETKHRSDRTTISGFADPPRTFTPPREKVDQHPAFGALKGMITIEPGYDIAASDPEIVAEWEDGIERKAAMIEAGLKTKQ